MRKVLHQPQFESHSCLLSALWTLHLCPWDSQIKLAHNNIIVIIIKLVSLGARCVQYGQKWLVWLHICPSTMTVFKSVIRGCQTRCQNEYIWIISPTMFYHYHYDIVIMLVVVVVRMMTSELWCVVDNHNDDDHDMSLFSACLSWKIFGHQHTISSVWANCTLCLFFEFIFVSLSLLVLL